MIEKLACKIRRNDGVPNIELVEELCKIDDTAGIVEIVDGLKGTEKVVANLHVHINMVRLSKRSYRSQPPPRGVSSGNATLFLFAKE